MNIWTDLSAAVSEVSGAALRRAVGSLATDRSQSIVVTALRQQSNSLVGLSAAACRRVDVVVAAGWSVAGDVDEVRGALAAALRPQAAAPTAAVTVRSRTTADRAEPCTIVCNNAQHHSACSE